MKERDLRPLDPPDEALVAQVSQHNVAAFTLLYDRYAKLVYALAVHLLGSADAEEVVQDVFLRLWHKADQFDARRGSFAAWFMAIARHRALDELQHRSEQQRLVAVDEIDQLLMEVDDPAADVEEQARLREWGGVALEALKRLPAEQRRVILLAYFGGLSQTSIAKHLGWPLGTVKKRLRLGLQKLRASLAQQGLAMEVQAEPARTGTK